MNLIPFDRATYDAAEVKPKVFTADGEPVRILATDIPGDQPVAFTQGQTIALAGHNGAFLEGRGSRWDLHVQEPEISDEEVFAFAKKHITEIAHVHSAKLFCSAYTIAAQAIRLTLAEIAAKDRRIAELESA